MEHREDHADRHGVGGPDELTADTNANARVAVRKNSTGTPLKRRRINLIESTSITITIADDSTDEEVDVTIGAPDVVRKDIGTTKGDIIAWSASATPARLGVGANDTILEADSAQSSGIRWGTAAVKKETGTTKGDLIVWTAASTPARIAVGANDTILEADSAQSSGMKWGTAPIKKATGSTKGDLIGFSANATPGRLPVGATNGQVLQADSSQTLGLSYTDDVRILKNIALHGPTQCSGVSALTPGSTVDFDYTSSSSGNTRFRRTFTKISSSSTLLVWGWCSAYNSSGLGGVSNGYMNVYIQINDGGTDYIAGSLVFNVKDQHMTLPLTSSIPSISAGSISVKLRWLTETGTAFTTDSGDYGAFFVQEIPA